MCNATTKADVHRTAQLSRLRARAKAPRDHESFIASVAKLAIARLSRDEQAKCKLRLVYGSGAGTNARGVTFYSRWQNGDPEPIDLVEICAFGEESLIQVAGTTVHEIAHVLAGHEAAHGPEWKAACGRLGLRCARAAGMRYSLAALCPAIRELVWRHEFDDGRPDVGMSVFGLLGVPTLSPTIRPCSHGVGSRGGTSRGRGSGSRNRKFTCGCDPVVIVRSARDELHATCDLCGEGFKRS